MTSKPYDFKGWASRNNLKCSDGRTILKDAFAECDGEIVPLVWNHQHDEPYNILGHALLKNRPEGVYTYCWFNDTEQGQNAKLLVEHGDISALSIFANQLKQKGSDVLHGKIREVSLVLAGANPGAYIDSYSFEHGEDSFEEAVIYTGEPIEMFVAHADDDEEEKKEMKEETKEETKEEKKETEEKEPEDKEDSKEDTVGDVYNTLNEKQKKLVHALVGAALESRGSNEEEEKDNMKHNVFEGEQTTENVLSHADIQNIFANAKRCGSLKEAVNAAIEDGVLAHSIDTTGMDVAVGEQTYGFNDPSMLFPDYKSLNNPPEWISRDMDWVSKVMSGVPHTPFSRIKSVYANITEDDARAKGYIKGNQKTEEVFTTLKRATDPQTIYKKQKLDRDDIIDIVDFDVVAWIRAEMRVMLNEEIARAILIGDGRSTASDDHISEDHVRSIVNDVPLFNIRHAVVVEDGDDLAEVALKTMDEAIRARKDYKGSGNPTFFTTEDVLTEMLLLKDGIGHKLYKSEAEVATALRVREVVTVEPMEGQQITVNNTDYDLIGVIVNLSDYNVGADKGGAISMFDDFDIDYNQQKYLIETRISGALIKPFSAITLYKKVSA